MMVMMMKSRGLQPTEHYPDALWGHANAKLKANTIGNIRCCSIKLLMLPANGVPINQSIQGQQ